MRLQHTWRLVTTSGFLRSQALDFLSHVGNSFRSDPYAVTYRTVRPYTMSGNARLRSLYDAILRTAAADVVGDVVECGTARGGSAALMALASRQTGRERALWVFDTFDGIPAPTAGDPDYDIASLYTGDFRGEFEEVRELFRRLGVLDSVHMVRGRFEDTVPLATVPAIAVLHLDGDWYQSVKVCLDHLYDRVSHGGIVQIDDYGHWAGARKAVDEFMRARSITVPLESVDYTGRRFMKP